MYSGKAKSLSAKRCASPTIDPNPQRFKGMYARMLEWGKKHPDPCVPRSSINRAQPVQ